MFRGALMGADAGAMTADGPSREGGEQAVVWGDFCSEIFCGARVRVKQRKVRWLHSLRGLLARTPFRGRRVTLS